MKSTHEVTGPFQLSLPLTVEKEIEVDGVGMGVLSDGTPYLTGRGLARMCGIDNAMVLEISSNWAESDLRRREGKIKQILRDQGLEYETLYIELEVSGSKHHAYPDAVCMAILEYYAFEAGPNIKEQATKNYRLFARSTFRDFIYNQVGYDPANAIPKVWKQFHDRVSLVYDSVPAGYFSIFKEIADVVVTLIRHGAPVGPTFVPDISAGIAWGKHWTTNELERKHGARIKYEHNYPDDFAQAASNPQNPWCYPEEALAEFRRWMREHYLKVQFPNYLVSKEREQALPPSFSQVALAAIEGRGTGPRQIR